jgi:3-deoxy-D-manno-octulosonic-acid transferase
MARSPGLIAYLALGTLRARLARRAVLREIAGGGPGAARLAERLGQPGLRRPEGALVWLHAAGGAQEAGLWSLARRATDALPRAAVLLTTAGRPALAPPAPGRILHQLAPLDEPKAVAAFLDHWRPAAGVWAGAGLRPALIHAAARSGTPLVLIDAGGAPSAARGWRRWTGLGPATLGCFATILATDAEAAAELAAAGAPPERIEVAGPLAEEAITPPANPRERDALGAVLRARPVWFAVCLPESEEATVLQAHRTVLGLAHRLLLILAPDDPARAGPLAARLRAEGWSVALRSEEGEPGHDTEVFLADVEGELGLWYRLAPVTFMGGTFTPTSHGGRSPLEPAALGSAILHGPGFGPHAGAYARFAAAGAARGVSGAESLAAALADLLSPELAAQMAHAAWRVSTGGAELNDRVIAFLRAAANGGGG